MFPLPLILIFIFFLALLSFFFSASETAIIGLSKIRLRNMIAKGIKRAQHIQRLVNNLDKFIVAILVGNNFVNIAISAIVTGIFVSIFGYRWGILIATFATTFFVLIFCEITPKIIAIKHTEKVALFTSPLMEWFVKLFSLVIRFFMGISNTILKLLRVKAAKKSPLITEEELRLMIEIGKEEGILSDEERGLLNRIFEFGDTQVNKAMIPKEEIVSATKSSTPEQLLNIFVEEGYARLPIYEGSLDNIIGIIYARDILYMLRDKGLFILQDLVHRAYYVPATMRVNELLRKFQAEKIQIAIVVDENKKTLGLVTMEDLIEEIVGEIEEKYTKRPPVSVK